jgi:hypothetical protein
MCEWRVANARRRGGDRATETGETVMDGLGGGEEGWSGSGEVSVIRSVDRNG